MPQENAHRNVFLAWGATVAVLVLVTVPFSPERRPPGITAADWILWAGSFSLFLLLFWVATSATHRTSTRRALLAAETAVALAILFARPALGLEGALLVAVAFQLGRENRPAPSIAWIVLQSLVMGSILTARFGIDHSVSIVAAYLPFQLLAWLTSGVLAVESRRREELARLNAELVTTRELLAASSRSAERLRISQELHDVFGHRLASLSLNLEVASRVPEEERIHFLQTAQSIARTLLGEVREVATNLRRDAPVDVSPVIHDLIRDVPRPAIHLECPDSLPLRNAEAAQVLLRCTQEIVTNSIKHSGGSNLWIQVRPAEGGIEMNARDDGAGAAGVLEGNGLRGMRERLAGIGGSLEIDAPTGFHVRLFMPGVAP